MLAQEIIDISIITLKDSQLRHKNILPLNDYKSQLIMLYLFQSVRKRKLMGPILLALILSQEYYGTKILGWVTILKSRV